MSEIKRKYDENRILNLDILRIIFSFGVVVIHAAGYKLVAFETILSPQSLYIAIFAHQLFSASIIIFFIISGFSLTNKYWNDINIKLYIIQRVKKIIVPYLLWSLFYIIIWPPTRINLNFKQLIFLLLSGDDRLPLYFVPPLFLMYLLFPIFIKIIRKLQIDKNKIIVIIILQLFLFYFYFYKGYNFGSYYIFQFFLLGVPSFILGIIFRRKIAIIKKISQNHRIFIGISIVLLFIIINFEVIYVSLINNYVTLRKSLYIWKPLSTILSYFIFIYYLSKNIIFSQFCKNIITIISRQSLNIFFMHIAILTLFYGRLGHYGLLKIFMKMPFSEIFLSFISVFIIIVMGELLKRVRFLIKI
jgi:peptidoglycan/LPS O-acetylase OafA/YrhL